MTTELSYPLPIKGYYKLCSIMKKILIFMIIVVAIISCKTDDYLDMVVEKSDIGVIVDDSTTVLELTKHQKDELTTNLEEKRIDVIPICGSNPNRRPPTKSSGKKTKHNQLFVQDSITYN